MKEINPQEVKYKFKELKLSLGQYHQAKIQQREIIIKNIQETCSKIMI